MKSPWKFLTDLALRRQKSEAEEKPIDAGDNRDVVADEAEPPSANHLGMSSPVLSGSSDDASLTDSPAKAVIPKKDVEIAPLALSKSSTENGEAEGKSGQEPARGVISAAGRDTPKKASNASANWAVRSGATHKLNNDQRIEGSEAVVETPTLSSSENAVFDEAVILDAEIKQLKVDLARKIQLQNSQLRKMLERFG
jgi:hypothetical protein